MASGVAIVIAISVIMNVPRNSGSIPKLLPLSALSPNSAVCGRHSVPNMKSMKDTFWKKSHDSNIMERIMSNVMIIEIEAEQNNTALSHVSI